MRRGTNVGEAYVAVSADGSGINDEINAAFDDVDFDRVGRKFNSQFAKQLEGEIQRIAPKLEELYTGIGRAIESDDSLSQGVRSQLRKAADLGDFDALYEKVGRDAGVRFGDGFDDQIRAAVFNSLNDTFQKAIRDGGSFDISDILRRINTGTLDANGDPETLQIVGPGVKRAVAEAIKAIEAVQAEQRKAFGESQDLFAAEGKARVAAQRSAAQAASEFLAAQEKMAFEGKQKSRERDQKAAEAAAAAERRRISNEAAFFIEQEKIRDAEEKKFQADRDRQAAADAKARLAREKEYTAALQREFEARDFAAAFEEATKRFQKLKFNPKIDRERIAAQFDRVVADLTKRNALKFSLDSDISPAERAKIEAQIRALDLKIDVGVDQKALNAALLRAQNLARGQKATTDKSLGDTVGRIFGAGSRNNFLNLAGKTIGGLTTATDKFVRSLGAIPSVAAKANAGGRSLFSQFRSGFAETDSAASNFRRTFSTIGTLISASTRGASLFASIGPSVARAGAALGQVAIGAAAISVALLVLIPLLSGLLGILTALASTIVSSLVAALSIASAGFAALVAAIGLTTLAFTSMTDAQKKSLKEGFLPVKQVATGLGQLIFREFTQPLNDGRTAIQTWSDNIQRSLGLLIPVAQQFGRAFVQAGNTLTASLSGAGFQNFAIALSQFLPSITTRLSSALGNFLNGLVGLFAILLPYVNQFAGFLDRVATNFNKFVNGGDNNKKIVDFFERAFASARAFANFLGEIGGLLGDLLLSTAGQNAGNNIFDDLTNAVANFRAFIADGGIERFFEDATRLADDLGSAFKGLSRVVDAFNSSKALALVGDALSLIGKILELVAVNIEGAGRGFKALGKFISNITSPVAAAKAALNDLKNVIFDVANASASIAGIDLNLGSSGKSAGSSKGGFGGGKPSNLIDASPDKIAGTLSLGLFNFGAPIKSVTSPSVDQVRNLGASALAATSRGSGGSKGGGGGKKKKFKNPYLALANSLIDNGPSVSAQIKNAILAANKEAADAFLEAASSNSAANATNALQGLVNSLTQTGESTVNTARSALNSAAQRLAGAGSLREAKKALRQVRAAQRDLRAALDNQARLNAAIKIVTSQEVVTDANVKGLVNGLRVVNATLADYAAAREQVAEKINDAEQKLREAENALTSYQTQVADSIRSFAALTTAQAQIIDGVEQALSATDITRNLQERLAKIKTFQNNLRLLLAQGLSDAAYKQLVDAGVESGNAYAEALLAGGGAAITDVNNLIGQIGSAADNLGAAAATRLYQAGVDTARGFLEGLKSLDKDLMTAAKALGDAIANAVKKALGIASPSKVMIQQMGYVGDGMVVGLDAQQAKVAAAANRLSGAIAVSPSAAYTSATQTQTVSGNNGYMFRDLIVQTPSADPRTVALETVNELVGRI